MSQKIRTSVEIDGSLKASQIANATIDTDKFLVSDGGIVKYRTGSEMLSDLGVAPGVASNIQHKVKASVAINKGQAVYVTSADGTNMVVGLASNSSESTSSKTMGLLNNTVPANGFANVVTEGLLSGLNTIGANAGDPVWLGTNGNLIYGLTNKPYAPNHLVFIGIVKRVNANNGEIFVKVQNGFELDELHDVDLKTTTPVNGHVLGYDGSLWVNKTIPGWLGYTPVPTARTITINGTTQDLSANRSWTISESDTLATVTARGASTSTQVTLSGGGNNSSTYSSLRFAGYNQGGGTGYYGFFEIENTYGSSTNQKKFFRLDSAGTIQIINSAYTNNIFNLTDAGDLTVGKIIKSGGGANEILAANGTVITAGTNITISGGVISASGSGGVTSFNTRTGAVTLTSGDVTTALGYTPADDAAVVHKAGTETITGEKTFSAIRTNISGGSLTLKSGAANRVIISSYNANEIEFGVTPAGTTYNSKFIFQSSARDYTFPNATGTVALTSDLAGFVPTSRTITINGVTQDLSANRSWTVSGGVSGSGSAGQVAFWNGASSITGESTLFWDSTNDRLGIGTDSPAQKLVVDGGSSDFTPIFAKSSLLSGGKYFGSLLAGYATTTSQSAQFGYVYDTSNIANSYAHITAYGTAEGSQFAMRANGNVQIGTTDAGYKLDVNGTGRFSGTLRISATTPTQEFYSTGNGDVWGSIKAEASTGTGGQLVLSAKRNGNTEIARVRITENGTTLFYPPNFLPVVIGGQGASYYGSNITLASDTGSTQGANRIWSRYDATGRAALTFETATNTQAYQSDPTSLSYTEYMRITGLGNVGIGTESPDNGKLTILKNTSRATESSYGIAIQSNVTNAYTELLLGADDTVDCGVIQTAGKNTSFTSKKLSLQPQGGNVLIGTTTDAGYKLDVNGNARVQTAIGVNAAPNTVYPVTIGCTSGANGLKIIGRSDNLGYIEFFNNNGTTVNSSLNGSTGGLQVTGATTFSSTVTATGFFNSSDIRLKEIVDYDYKVSDIKPISYLWKDSRDNKKHVGYSAQEVQKVMPDAVNEDADGMLSVNYIEVLVAKIAELENRIKQLEK